MRAPPDPLYMSEPAAHWVLHTLDDISLLYHRRSGQTHMMVSPAPEILCALGEGPGRADDIVERLSALYDLGDPQDARAAVVAHLADLAALGLTHVVKD